MGKAQFVENNQLVAGIIPVDLQTAANNGDWVSLKLYRHVTCVFFAAAGTAGDDPVFKMQQAQAVAGTNAKDLLFDTIYTKTGTLATAGSTTRQFTKVTQAAATSYTDATHAEVQKIYVVEFDDEDLDVENGFDCVQMSVADVGGNAQIGCGFYILSNPRYTPPQSAIED